MCESFVVQLSSVVPQAYTGANSFSEVLLASEAFFFYSFQRYSPVQLCFARWSYSMYHLQWWKDNFGIQSKGRKIHTQPNVLSSLHIVRSTSWAGKLSFHLSQVKRTERRRSEFGETALLIVVGVKVAPWVDVVKVTVVCGVTDSDLVTLWF